MNTSQFLARLQAVKKSGDGWEARCPAHADRKASLSVSTGKDGRILLHCHAGCSVESIVGVLGFKRADLFPPRTDKPVSNKPRIVATYDYDDETGARLFQCVRFEPKDFRQRRPDPAKPGQWIWNLNGVRRVLYRLLELKTTLADGRTIQEEQVFRWRARHGQKLRGENTAAAH